MSKALVIKGANFAANKVETITLTQPIPCTGISISPSTISFTSLGATQQITATLTPNDTTDTVYYVSSNEDIVTVSDSGLATCVGIGSATITVTCGEQSETCAVTAAMSVIAEESWYAENGYNYSGSMDLNANPPKNHIGRATSSRARLFYSTTEYGKYRVFISVANEGKYAIPIPKGTTYISITPPEGLRSYINFVLANADEKQTYVGGADGQAALGIMAFVQSSPTIPYVVDVSEYPEANGFIFSVLTPSGSDPSEVTGSTTVVFS